MWVNKITRRDWTWHTQLCNLTTCFKSLTNWFLSLFISQSISGSIVSPESFWPWKRTIICLQRSYASCIWLSRAFIDSFLLAQLPGSSDSLCDGSMGGSRARAESTTWIKAIRKRQAMTSAILISTRFYGGCVVLVNAVCCCTLTFIFLWMRNLKL